MASSLNPQELPVANLLFCSLFINHRCLVHMHLAVFCATHILVGRFFGKGNSACHRNHRHCLSPRFTPRHFVQGSNISLECKIWVFSRRRLWRMVSSGMLRRVALVRTDVLEELSASFIRVTRIGDLGTILAVTSSMRRLLVKLVLLPVHRFLSPWWRRR
jgi:hypothetical protein